MVCVGPGVNNRLNQFCMSRRRLEILWQATWKTNESRIIRVKRAKATNCFRFHLQALTIGSPETSFESQVGKLSAISMVKRKAEIIVRCSWFLVTERLGYNYLITLTKTALELFHVYQVNKQITLLVTFCCLLKDHPDFSDDVFLSEDDSE